MSFDDFLLLLGLSVVGVVFVYVAIEFLLDLKKKGVRNNEK